ncbi:hypothetical protein [Streptomyces nitrosporeus]|uniref:hypothetical protein n=1 Tax=Streptomyces nitrosporeus TaxID=28894 RepID=UPI0033214EF2
MEQRIDSNNKPEFAAGTDPAFIPGLTAPAPVLAEGGGTPGAPKEPEEPEASRAPAEAGTGAVGAADVIMDKEEAANADKAPEKAGGAEEVEDSEGVEDHKDSEGAEDPEDSGKGEGSGRSGGPVFEVSDRRGAIRVDREGVRFQLDDQEAEFDWSEIGAVEVKTPRFGRRFTVTVHLSSRRWFNAEVEAGARKDLKTWTAELDEALDAYFEES